MTDEVYQCPECSEHVKARSIPGLRHDRPCRRVIVQHFEEDGETWHTVVSFPDGPMPALQDAGGDP